MHDGRTGAELARAFEPLRGGELGEALDRLGRARVLVGDVIALDRRVKLATLRDVFDGALYRVRVDPKMARGLTRWTRLFALVVELEDGTYYPPSTMSVHPWLRNVAPRDFVMRLNAALEERRHAERVDENQPHAGLVRWVGLAHGVLRRMIAPTPAQAAEMAKKLYIVNSDGDRLEPHDATLSLDLDLDRSLAGALEASDDFLRGDAGFEMVGAPRGTEVLDTESLASVHLVKPGEWRATANSTARYERLLARLEAFGGRSVEVTRLEVMKPWELQDRAAAEESAETTRVVMASARIDAPTTRAAKTVARDVILDAPFRAIDDHVPALGGKPREIVTTSEGRARVESWLADWEAQGMPGADGWAFVDLDPVRHELGLPPIAPTAKR